VSRRAIILAGGLGTRLRPYTTTIPKPLMPVGERPILDIVLRQLSHFGFRDVTIATGYLAELIEAFVRDGRDYGVKVDYFREKEPLGTVGALALIDGLEDPFLVMNGDVLTDLDYRALMQTHIDSGAAATIATHTRDIQVSLGVLEFDDAGDPLRLTGYVEKPTLKYQASMGVYCFRPDVVAHIEAGAHLDFPDLVLKLIAAGEEVRSLPSQAYWMDIGRHDDYEQAQEDFDGLRRQLLPFET
jgi:NDP-sugar pyrophosphorylase family protein